MATVKDVNICGNVHGHDHARCHVNHFQLISKYIFLQFILDYVLGSTYYYS